MKDCLQSQVIYTIKIVISWKQYYRVSGSVKFLKPVSTRMGDHL